ncbi:MAG: aldehyde dehydrogenase EutE, partial [Pirellulales bacterium]|nr:aldehyde dehydrogenase EutE [Pirellulales bacterium]
MQVDETLIRNVVEQVLAKVGKNGAAPAAAAPAGGGSYAGRFGMFTCANEAVAASREAFEELSGITMEGRKRIIDHIRRIS